MIRGVIFNVAAQCNYYLQWSDKIKAPSEAPPLQRKNDTQKMIKNKFTIKFLRKIFLMDILGDPLTAKKYNNQKMINPLKAKKQNNNHPLKAKKYNNKILKAMLR